MTRNSKRVEAFTRIADEIVNPHHHVMSHPYFISVTAKSNLASIAETGLRECSYFIDSVHPCMEAVITRSYLAEYTRQGFAKDTQMSR